MKVQDLLSDFLQENKRLSLQSIGIFEAELDPGSDTPDSGKSIRFTPDKNTILEEPLLDFLKSRTGKMKSLAQSDLESFISSGKQLLNIGKPFEIPGIGFVQKTSEGIYHFQPGFATSEQLLTEHNKQLVESAEKSRQIKPEFYGKKKKIISNKTIATVVVLLVSLLIWLLFLRKPSSNQATVEPAPPAPELIETPVVQDSLLSNPADSLQGFELTVRVKKDSIQSYFQFLLNSGHPVRLDTTTAADAKIFFQSERSLKDTSLVIDSLRKFFKIESVFKNRILN